MAYTQVSRVANDEDSETNISNPVCYDAIWPTVLYIIAISEHFRNIDLEEGRHLYQNRRHIRPVTVCIDRCTICVFLDGTTVRGPRDRAPSIS